MRQQLEIITNIATLVTCIAVGVFLYQNYAQPVQTGQPATYSKGDRISQLSDAKFSSAPKTLLLALRKDCHFCEESIPFYRTLVNAAAKDGRSIQLVVVTTDDLTTATGFLESNQIHVSRVLSVPPTTMTSLKVPGTPTLILTDSQGIVQQVWIGKLSDSAQREVLQRLQLVGTQSE